MKASSTERLLLAVGFACGLEYMQHFNSLFLVLLEPCRKWKRTKERNSLTNCSEEELWIQCLEIFEKYLRMRTAWNWKSCIFHHTSVNRMKHRSGVDIIVNSFIILRWNEKWYPYLLNKFVNKLEIWLDVEQRINCWKTDKKTKYDSL